MTNILNQPIFIVVSGPDIRAVLAEIGEAIRDGRAIVVSGEPVEDAKPSHPGIVRALPVKPFAANLRRVG